MNKTFPIVVFAAILAAVGCASQSKVSQAQQRVLRSQDNLPPRIVITNGPPELRQYDEFFVNEVGKRWYDLLDALSLNDFDGGKVVVRFQLHDDGRVTNTAILTNTTSDVMLGLLCQKAILDPQPYPPWPRLMRFSVAKSYRDIDFSFYYNSAQTNLPAAGRKIYPRPSHRRWSS